MQIINYLLSHNGAVLIITFPCGVQQSMVAAVTLPIFDDGVFLFLSHHLNMSRLRNGLLQLQSVPPGWGLTFSSYPLRLAKIAFTPEDFRKIWVYPWRIGSYPWRIWVDPWRILWKLRLHPQRIPYFFTLPLKKSSIFITYPWRIPWFLNRERGKWKRKWHTAGKMIRVVY